MPEPDSARQRTLAVNGVDLHLSEVGEGPPVILAHGFPELGYSWRHQLPALAAAGYRAVAPDQRGYGRSSRPAAVEDYDILSLTGDLIAVLDDLGEDKAVFVGHDWGAIVAWHVAMLAPERVRGVVGMSVPYIPRPPMPPTELFRSIFGDSFFYMLYFQEPGVADAELGADPRRTMWRLLAGMTPNGPPEAPDVTPSPAAAAPAAPAGASGSAGFIDRLPEPRGLPDWLAAEELDHYVEEFTRTGFTGGINWYRNLDRNWELTPQLEGARIEVPSLFIGGAADPVLVMMPPAAMEPWLADHRGSVIIDGAGHWVQQERPGEVNAALLGFMAGLRRQEGGYS